MSLLFPSQHDDIFGIICRVDSSVISLIIIEKKTRKIVGSIRESFSLFLHDNRHYYDQLLHHAQLIIRRMVQTLIQQGTPQLSFCSIIISEPWAQSIDRQITYSRKTPFTITEKFIDELIARDMKKMEREYQLPTEFSELRPEVHYREIAVSGYRIGDPWGRTTQSLSIQYLVGYTDPQIVSLCKKIFHETLKIPLRSIFVRHYHAHCIEYYHQYGDSQNALIIHPVGYTTDLFIFQKGYLQQMGTLPTGLSQARAELADMLGIFPKELESLLTLYSKGLLSGAITKRLETHLYRIYRNWEKDFHTYCHHAVIHGDIIDTVVWVGDDADPLFQFFMYQVQHDKDAFSVLFGNTQVRMTKILGQRPDFAWKVPDDLPAEDVMIITTLHSE